MAAWPAGAPAATFFVDDDSAGPSPCLQANPCETVQEGLDAAAANGTTEVDTVQVAPGMYSQFDWKDASYSDVRVQGAGTGVNPTVDTIVEPDGGSPFIIAIPPAAASGAQLRNLRVSDPPTDMQRNRRGLQLGGAQTVLEDVVVDLRHSPTQPGIEAIDPRFTFNRVELSTDGTAEALFIGGGSAPGPSITNTTIETHDARGIVAFYAPSTYIGNSRISSANDTAVSFLNSQLVLDSSLVTSAVVGLSIGVDDGTATRQSDVRNSTIDAPTSLLASGQNTGSVGKVTVNSSILAGQLGVSQEFDGAASITCNNSNIPAEVFDCGASRGNTTAAPESLFVDRAAGDYRVKGGSVAIDTGIPGPVGGFSSTDVAGNARIHDGDGDGTATLDKGAFEYQRLGPPTAAISGPGTGYAGKDLKFTASGTDPDPGDALSFTWTFSDGAPAQSGVTAQKSFAAGTHTVTVTVTDPTGMTGTATNTIQIYSFPEPPRELPRPTVGDDNLVLLDSADYLCGLAGSDVIDGGAGNDAIFGDQCGEKARRLFGVSAGDGNDTLLGNTGNDQLFGSGGDDWLRGGPGKDALGGGSGNDRLEGDAGTDVLDGGKGDDRVYGGADADWLIGRSGNDRISGGDGRDKLEGGSGKDSLTGGKGRNSYAAGSGDDTVNAANGVKETVDCGTGKKDKATVDKSDRVKGCEKVKRTKK
jgi:Ca2+-binding RTX toxin-like protein